MAAKNTKLFTIETQIVDGHRDRWMQRQRQRQRQEHAEAQTARGTSDGGLLRVIRLIILKEGIFMS